MYSGTAFGYIIHYFLECPLYVNDRRTLFIVTVTIAISIMKFYSFGMLAIIVMLSTEFLWSR